MTTDTAEWKRQATAFAVDFVESGMVVGLGHGSTAIHAVKLIAERLNAGRIRDITGIPCSFQAEEEALRYGVPVTTLDARPSIDLTIDGADEVDPSLNLIKGGGGALLREKIVAQASRRVVIVVDESKLSPMLGTKRSVPLEVIPFGWRTQLDFLESMGAKVTLRRNADKSLFKTDQGNLIMDCRFGPIMALRELVRVLESRAGIVEHGLFLDAVSEVVAAGKAGVRHLKTS
ncbi:MAG: ribose 5-phosphate isomerase A [Syntrophaceae bacterium]|nr:ribose 5-phosphate isomerase A [Syntrophaceae bacterium]